MNRCTLKLRILQGNYYSGVISAYFREDKNRLILDEFKLPFSGKPDATDRWVQLAEVMPWDKIEEINLRTMSIETDRRATPSRMAFGAIFIKEYRNYTDEEVVAEIRENP